MPEKQKEKEKRIYPKSGFLMRTFSFTKDEMEEKLRKEGRDYFGRELNDKDIKAFVELGVKHKFSEKEFLLFCNYYDKGINQKEFEQLRERDVAVRYRLSPSAVKTLIKIRDELNLGRLQDIFREKDDKNAVKILKSSKPPKPGIFLPTYSTVWEKFHEPVTIYSVIDTEQGVERDGRQAVGWIASKPLTGERTDYGIIRHRRRQVVDAVFLKHDINGEVWGEIKEPKK